MIAPRDGDASESRWFGILTTIATGVAAGLVLRGLGNRSLWLDEAFSVTTVERGITHVLHEFRHADPNMVLYHVILVPWMEAFGTSERAIRLLSALCMIGTVPVVAQLGRALIGPRAGVFAGVLAATHPFLLRYGQEARAYAFLTLLVTAMSLALVRAVRTGSAAAWCAWGIAGGVVVYAHLFAALVFGIEAGWALVVATQRRRVIAASALAAALWTPLAAVSLARGSTQLSWIPVPGSAEVLALVTALCGCSGIGAQIAHGLLWIAGVLVLWRSSGRAAALVLAWGLVPPAVVFVVSQWVPLFRPRYFLLVLPALLLASSAALARLRPTGVAVLGLGTLVATQGAGIAALGSAHSPQDWRSATRWILEHGDAGDAVIPIAYEGAIPLAYYHRQLAPAVAMPIVRLEREAYVTGGPLPPIDPDLLDRTREDHPRVWVVANFAAGAGVHRLLADVTTRLVVSHDELPPRHFPGIIVRRFERRAAR